MSTIITEINKLKNIQQSLEKNDNALIEQLCHIDPKSQLGEFYIDITNNRKAQKEKLQNDVKEIVDPLYKVKNLLQNNIENIDLHLLKKDMTKIQKNINNLQSYTKISLAALQKEEDKLLEDINKFEKNVQEWSKPIKSNFRKRTAIKRVSTSLEATIPQEVAHFTEYVAVSGGHENGWTAEDHNLFLRARTKTKNVQHLAEILHTMLPDISEEEVISHENWYKKYMELKEHQKQVIINWRQKKIKMKQINTLPKPKPNSIQISNYHTNVQKDELQDKIMAWKAEKRAQMKNERLQKQHEILKKKEQEIQQKSKHQQIKREIMKWKQVKEAAEAAERVQKETAEESERENRAAKANKLIKEFQKQDNNFLQRKLQMRLSQLKGPDALKVSQVEAPRDPQRLLKPTKQWILRTYGSDESGTVHNKLSLQAIPKLGIPEWRKSIN